LNENLHSGHGEPLAVNDLVKLNQDLKLLKESIRKKKAEKEQARREGKKISIDLSPEIRRVAQLLSEIDNLSKKLKSFELTASGRNAEQANSLRNTLGQLKAQLEALATQSATPKQDFEPLKDTRSLFVETGREERYLKTPNNDAVKGELDVAKSHLQQYVREMTTMKEKEATLRNEIESLRSEVHSLRERLLSNAQEVQKLRTRLEEQSVKLQNQPRDIELQRKEMKVAGNNHTTGRLAAHTFLPQYPAPPRSSPPPEFPPDITSQQPFRRCANCSRPLSPHDRFCDTCGFQAYSPESRGR
jgi:chromosome segregation ATPase